MRAKVKTAKRKAAELHGASSQYVSLVDAGANETPFQLLKNQDGESAMGIKKRAKSVRKSHKAVNPSRKQKAENVETKNMIAKMIIDGGMFDDEAGVQAYLEEAEWEAEETSIVQNDDGDWEVRPDGTTDEDFIRIEEVDTETEGVQAFVGQIEVNKSDDDPADEEEVEDDPTSVEKDDGESDEDDDDGEGKAETAQKADKAEKKTRTAKATSTKKAKVSKRAKFLSERKATRETEQNFDSWDARVSHANTLAKALKAGMEWDGVPPGYYEVQAAFNGVAMSVVGDESMAVNERQEALNKAALEFAEIIGGLDSFFDDYLDMDENTVAKSYEGQTRTALAKWADGFADFVSGEEAETVAKEPAKKSATSGDSDKTAPNIADLVAKALDPVVSRVEELGETVQAMASRTPTKKAADGEELGSAKKSEDDKADKAAQRFGKSFLG